MRPQFPFVAVLTLVAAHGLAAAGLQPFVLPWDDASAGATNLQAWQPTTAGTSGWVQVTSSGHYALAGQPIRFLGVDIAAASAMPTHARADAHAARLARFGFNAVRLHHLEAPWDKANVLIDYANADGTSRHLAPDRLDKLQYLVAQLAAHGVYTDLNLLVSREFQAADGLGAEVTQLGWKDQQVLGFFNDTALALHQEYATKVLTAPNPYRNGVPFAQDPAVAFVEIMNENGLLQKWHEGVLDTMPALYRGQLQARWNQWLAQRYANTSALLAGWGAVDQPLGTTLLTNGNFASGVSGWNTEQHDTATATFTGTSDFNGAAALKISVTHAGTASWHVQVNQAPLALAADGYYTLTFWAKADQNVPFYGNLARAYGDYGMIGSGVSTTLGTTWQQYTVALQNGAAESNARVNFGGFGDRVCTVWLADVRVQPGGKLGGLPAGVSLEAANVPSLLKNPAGGVAYTLGQRTDWTRCLLALETSYWSAMYHHVKTTLGYSGIVWATILANSPPNTQAGLDAMDSHAYWQHPTWPPGQDWDPVTWTIPNTSMVNDAAGGTLGGIARQRVRGKPHNVTEYQHPSPSTFTSEGPLLAAAYASLQDWDGLWFFAYETTDAEYVTGFFDQGTHPGRMANCLLAAALFRRGDVARADQEYTMAFSPEKEIEVATTSGSAWNVGDGAHLGVPASLALRSRINLAIGAGASGLTTPPAAPTGSAIASDTGELLWDNSVANKGVITVNAPRTKAAIGYTAGRSWNLGGVVIAPGTTRNDWCTVGVTLLDGTAFDAAAGGRALVVATGDGENTGQIWKDATHTSLGTNWGTAPTLIEVVPATVTLPVAASRVTAWALDGRGQRMNAVPVTDVAGQARLTLGTSGTTLWYEVLIASNLPPNAATYGATTFPTATHRQAHLTFTATLTNAGTKTWGGNHYVWLRDSNGANLSIASVSGVAPGGSTTVTLHLDAPATPGNYAYRLQALENNVEWFSTWQDLSLHVTGLEPDFNADGHADLVWQNTVTGERGLWLMNGLGFSSWFTYGAMPVDWNLAGTADFNADGSTDILWQNTSTGERGLWLMNGLNFSSWVSFGIVPVEWRIGAVADFNGDGSPDILWQNTTTGECGLWLMSGPNFASWLSYGVMPLDWRIATAGDFNADGSPDIVWQNTTTGERGLWLMNGLNFSSWVSYGVVSTDWDIAAAADYDGDGQTDLLWQNTATGERGLWLMSGPNFASWLSFGVVPTDWRLAP